MRRTWRARVAKRAVAALTGAALTGAILAGCTTPDASPSASDPPSRAASPAPLDPAAGSPPAGPPSAGTPTPAPGDDTAEPAAPSDGAVFTASVSPIPDQVAARMVGVSWREGCPVPLSDLRYLTVTHRTVDGGSAHGELVVHADVADGLVGVLRALFDAGYPIRSMRLVDDFGASDDASMAAGNTSAFNCRVVAGTQRWSEHAYGRAIDVNPIENPWVSGSNVQPPAGAAYVARPAEPGVILPGDAVVRAFAAAGWSWGGAWDTPKDYQHFSTTGR